MRLFVGLGNPGTKYARNRHNVGFMAVERIAEHLQMDAWQDRFEGQVAEGELGGERLLVLKPATGMNASGRSIVEAHRFFNIPIDDIYVFHDEIYLPPGKVKVKTGGGNAGHNGLGSITTHIGNDYKRVRIGVDRPGDGVAVAHYVLRDFAQGDDEWLDPLLDAMAISVRHLTHGKGGAYLSEVTRLVREHNSANEGTAASTAANTKASESKSATKRLSSGVKDITGSLTDTLRQWYSSIRKLKDVRKALNNRRTHNLARFRRSTIGSRATYIAITGSSAKTTTTSLLSHILSANANVQTQVLQNTRGAACNTLRSMKRHHDYVVCEIGTGGPGTLKPMIDLIKPSVGIVTLVGLEHYSAFRTYEAVAAEKGTLVEALPDDGLAILNADDDRVAAMASRTSARTVTFGESSGDYKISNVQVDHPGQLGFSITYDNETFDLTTRFTGAHNCVAVAAAFSCALQLGIAPSVCQERIASFEPVFGRCSVHHIENGPTFVLDTCKAPYYSVHLAVEMMAHFNAPRKRIIVGKISDASDTNPKYRDIYRAARDVADQVIFVGDNAHRSKATAEEILAGRFVEKRTVQDAAAFVRETAMPGEIILLKSGAKSHLERLLLQFQHEVCCWEQNCKKSDQCIRCELLTKHHGKAVA